MKPIVLTWLSYLTPTNYTRRINMYRESMSSLCGLKDCDIVIVDNDPTQSFLVDNVRAEIGLGCADSVRDCPQTLQVFRAKNEWFDVAAHYTGLLIAEKMRSPYFMYSYEDFVFYDHDFMKDAVEFMDTNPEVSCIRMVKYEADNKRFYDKEITPRTTNVHAVMHSIGGTRNAVVKHYDKQTIGTHVFYKSNWRPQSLPTLWRTSDFRRLVGFPNPCPVMQGFEGYMYAFADLDENWVSGFVDMGVCSTFPQETSERIAAGNNYPDVQLGTLVKSLKSMWGF